MIAKSFYIGDLRDAAPTKKQLNLTFSKSPKTPPTPPHVGPSWSTFHIVIFMYIFTHAPCGSMGQQMDIFTYTPCGSVGQQMDIFSSFSLFFFRLPTFVSVRYRKCHEGVWGFCCDAILF